MKNEQNKGDLQQWRELLEDDDMPAHFKVVIRDFLLPYKINPIKYLVNHDGTTDPTRFILYDNDPLFSESLRKIQQNPTIRVMGYPSWFYLAFPDVALWAIKGEGKKIIINKFSDLEEEEFIDSETNKIRHRYLDRIIKFYLENGNRLECVLEEDEM